MYRIEFDILHPNVVVVRSNATKGKCSGYNSDRLLVCLLERGRRAAASKQSPNFYFLFLSPLF
jgi:hypothetical protein